MTFEINIDNMEDKNKDSDDTTHVVLTSYFDEIKTLYHRVSIGIMSSFYDFFILRSSIKYHGLKSHLNCFYQQF